MVKKRGLGRSLEALLTKPSGLEEGIALESSLDPSKERLAFLSFEQILPGKYQPRHDIDPDSLQELAESIRAQGIIQPIVVRRLKDSAQYELIAGERRWRAAQLAKLSEIPAIIRELPDEAAMAMALIENIQRESLNPIEEADALQKLITQFEMTHQQLAEAVGKSRASITNSLRLLSLEPEVKAMVEAGQLEMGHARTLLSLSPELQKKAATIIVEQDLSVRQAEKLARLLPAGINSITTKKPQDPDLKRIQRELSQRLGLRVKIEAKQDGKGKVIIHYSTLTEFDHLINHLPKTKALAE